MSNVPMPEPVGFLHICRKKPMVRTFSFREKSKELAVRGYFPFPVITTIQAQAYADARLAEVQQWINVDERLPDDGDSVMFVVDCRNPGWKHLHGKVLGGTYRNSPFGGFGVPGLSIGASHWMPLPPPPQHDNE